MKYIVFEGCDGAGKTWQANRLVNYLSFRGSKIELTREPGSDHNSFSVRDLLLSADGNVTPETRELLFQADRAEHTKNILHMLQGGCNVVSDRSFVSGLAYALANGHKIDRLLSIFDFAVDVIPDHLFFLDCSAETSMKRMNNGEGPKTKEELQGIEHMKRVRQCFFDVLFSPLGRDHECDLLRQFDDICKVHRLSVEHASKVETADKIFSLVV